MYFLLFLFTMNVSLIIVQGYEPNLFLPSYNHWLWEVTLITLLDSQGYINISI